MSTNSSRFIALNHLYKLYLQNRKREEKRMYCIFDYASVVDHRGLEAYSMVRIYCVSVWVTDSCLLRLMKALFKDQSSLLKEELLLSRRGRRLLELPVPRSPITAIL